MQWTLEILICLMRHLWRINVWKCLAEYLILSCAKCHGLCHLVIGSEMALLTKMFGNMLVRYCPAGGLSGHKSPAAIFLCKSEREYFLIRSLTPLLCFKSHGRWRNKCGPRQNFQFIDMNIGKCTAVGNIPVWASCFPPFDELPWG